MIVPKSRKEVLPSAVKLEKLLLVEGETPAHFFEALAKHLGLAAQIEIRSFGGISQLGLFLQTLASTAEFRAKVRSLGIIRDAEDNAGRALAAVQTAVAQAKLDPQVLVNYFILPDNREPGMIETLCLRSVEQENGFNCLDPFLECAIKAGIELPSGIILAKNRVQAYLAMHKETQMMPGVAAYKGVWPFDHQAFSDLRAFLRSL